MAGEWGELPFSDAVTVNPPVELKRGVEYPFVDMQAVNPGVRCVYPSERRVFDGGGSRFAAGDTLMARITPCLENGKIGRFCASPDSMAHGSTEFIVVRGRVGITYTAYAYYLTKWEGVSGYAVSQMTGTSGRQRVPTESLDHLRVPIPPLDEQRAIAHILGTLDDKIELNRRMNETLEAIARALFKSWFADAIMGGLPKGWREGKVEELLTLSRETISPSEFPDEVFDHYSIPAFDEGRLPKSEPGEQIQSNKFLVPPDAAMISKLNPRIPRVWLPMVSAERRSVASTEFLVAVAKSGITQQWLYGLFSSPRFLGVFATLVTGTSGSHQRVKPEYLLAMEVEIPSQQRMREYAAITEPLHDRIALNLQESRTLAALRDTLLPKLLSGELWVKDLAKRRDERFLPNS